MILHPSYFLDVVSLLYIFKNNGNITFEKHDSYVKQTYRNRCYIAAANGKLALNIPIIHQKKGSSVPYHSIHIDHSQQWQIQHLKSITSAYRSSPYFDYYEDDLRSLYNHIPDSLMEWNLKTFQWIMDQLLIPYNLNFTTSYKDDSVASRLITAKSEPVISIDPYLQVFQEKHGFLKNLSAIDLIFNLGPSARVYLKSQEHHLQRLP